MAFFNYKGSQVHYESKGEGTCVVLLHGFLQNLSMWDILVERLSDSFQVIRVDFPGFGRSEVLLEEHSMVAFSDCLIQLLQEINVVNFQCIAHSMGGYVALSALQKIPGCIEHLCLFHSTASPDTKKNKINRDRAIKCLLYKPDLYISTAVRGLFNQQFYLPLEEEIFQMITQTKKLSINALASTIKGMKHRKDYNKVLSNSICRKNYVAGRLDPIHSFETLKNEAKFNGAVFIPIKDGGHMSHLEQNDQVHRILIDLIENIEY